MLSRQQNLWLRLHPQTVRYRLGQLRALFGSALDEPATRAALLLALAWGPVVTTATRPTGRPRSSISLFSVLAGSVLRGEEAIFALLQRSRETFAMSSATLLGRIDADIRPDGMPSENPQQWMILGTAGAPTARCPSEADVTVPVGQDAVLALSGRLLPAADQRVLMAFGAQVAVALDRDHLTRQAAQASCGRWAVTPTPVNGAKPPPTTA